MNILFSWADTPAARALGTVLLHTLWQAPLIAAALWGTLKCLPAARAPLRSAAAGLALVAVVVAAVVTHAAVTLPASSHVSDTPAIAAAAYTPASSNAPRGAGIPSVAGPTGQFAPAPTPTPIPWSALALALAAWALGATLLLLNTLRAVAATHTLTRGPGTGRVEPWAHDVLAEVKQRLHLRRPVRLLTSAAAHTPMVLGALFPVIVLPPALAAGLTTQQLRVVLAHELAHVKRHDYLFNLVQRLIEALLFFNPAVWFIGRQIRLEREAACDHAAAAALDGDRLHVARTLVDVLQQLTPAHSSTHPTAALALPLGQPHEPTLATRVHRLLHPHLRDAARIPWPTLLRLLTLSSAALYAVACGSEAAVAAVDKIVNPQKYIADTRDAATNAQNRLPEPRRDTDGRVVPEDKIALAGVITTHDHAPLPRRGVYVNTSSRSHRHGHSGTAKVRPNPGNPAQLLFETRDLPSGEIYFLVQAPGYAPASAGPLTVGPGETRDDLAVVLQPGFDLPVQVNDPQGRPLAGVALDDLWIRKSETSQTGRPGDAPVTDAHGRVVLHNVGPQELSVRLATPGYQRAHFQINPKPGDVWQLTLAPAITLTGTVLSNTTGQPLPGAQIHIAWGSDHPYENDPRHPYRERKPADATCDPQGRFILDTLTPGANYTLFVSAPGHAPRFVPGVFAPIQTSAPPTNIQLLPEIKLVLQVSGTPEQLASLPRDRRGNVTASCGQSVEIRNGSRSTSSERVELDFSTTPASAVFGTDLVDGPGQIILGNHRVDLPDLRAAAESGPVQIDLAHHGEAPSTRPVRVSLSPPAGWPPPEGTATVSYRQKPTDPYRSNAELPIVNGAISFDVILDDDASFEVQSVNAPGSWLPIPRDYNARQTRVTPGDTPRQLTLGLQPAGLVTGTVTDESGNPLPDAQLSLHTLDQHPSGETDPNQFNDFRTDPHGRFVISRVPFGGRYRVTASNHSLGKFACGYTVPFTLSPDDPRPDHPVTVYRGTDVTVTVTDPDGRPVAGAAVDVHREGPDHGHGWSPHETTDGRGAVVLPGVLLDDPAIRWHVSVAPHQGLSGRRVAIDADQVQVTLKPGLTVNGVLLNDATGEPVANARLKATVPWQARKQAAYSEEIPARTDAQGRFQIRGLEPGVEYLIEAETLSDFAATAALVATSSGGVGYRQDLTTRVIPNANTPPIEMRVTLTPFKH